jgi:hypothetical protein
MMNKQLTKKTIGIAASAALMASVAFSGSALAGPGGNGKKEQASIGVSAYCKIENVEEGVMAVYVSIEDKSSGNAYGQFGLDPVQIVGVTKDRGPVWTDIPGAKESPSLDVPSYEVRVPVNICGGGELGSAINAQVSVMLALDETSLYSPSKSEYTAQCGDDPNTDETEGGLKTADFEGLCSGD